MITPICVAMQVCRWNMILCIDFSLKTISTVVTKRSKKNPDLSHNCVSWSTTAVQVPPDTEC